MSGSAGPGHGDDLPVVDLAGSAMSALLAAIPDVELRTGRRVIVIGGLAVVCRLSRPHRATTDLDTVVRRGVTEPSNLDLLLASGAETAGPVGVLVPTKSGDVRVDLLEITDADLAELPVDANDRLHILAHAWAAESASDVVLRGGSLELVTLVATEAPLVAMKLQALPNRGKAKEATDLLDVVRIVLDPRAGPRLRGQFLEADVQLRSDALLHAGRWFSTDVQRSQRLLREIPEARDVSPDDLLLVYELLAEMLEP